MTKQSEKQKLDQRSTDRNPTSKPYKEALDNKSRQVDPKQQPLKPKK